MTVKKAVKRKLFAGIILALLVALVTPLPARAGVICTVSVNLNISDVSAMKIKHNHATIYWRTDGEATSQVFYDTLSHDILADYTNHTTERKNLAKEHKVNLNKLSPFTTYYYRVRSTVGGAEFISAEYTFKTLTSPGGWKWWWASLFN